MNIRSAAPKLRSGTGRRSGMRFLPGGRFRMGSENFYPEEQPVREVFVRPFWIDVTPVTNRQFARFVAATGYTTFAELPPNPQDLPGLLPEFQEAGSILFSPPAEPVSTDDPARWWRWVEGANWRQPLGPGSTLDGLERHPVVHIALCDAQAYAKWAGKALATEAEWEFAARGGLEGADYAWGSELFPQGRRMAKIWEGTFPWRNEAAPDRLRTAPVRSYPPNGFGLYDLIGNVWEWTEERYDPAESSEETSSDCCAPTSVRQPTVHILKGGSHLCAPEYCRRYRPAARWPQPADTTTSHVGFRCVFRSQSSTRL